jgi:hypothetical protein
MALMLGALYDALLAGNVPSDKAQKAAEEAAAYENRLARIEGDLTLIKWMVGFSIALIVAVLMLLLRDLSA